MVTILGILGVIVFIASAYFMGNKALDTFYEGWVRQLMSSFYGILLWIGIGLVGLLCWGVYSGVYSGIYALANAL